MPSRRSILLVDDDEDIRETFGDALRFEGYDVQTAANGQEAVDWLHRHADGRWLVLLDIMMPVMDGTAFLAARKLDTVLAGFPVIVLTAGGDCRELQAIHQIAGCVPKTVMLYALVAAIEACG